MATRTLRQAKQRQHIGGDVILDVVFEHGLLFLAIRNIGARPVTAVSVSFDQPVVGLGGTREVSAMPLFRRVEFLAPGREIRTLLDSAASYFARGQPERIASRITYRDERGRSRTIATHHDLGIYKAIAYVAETPHLRGGT
ncbi:MAG: hypothetical protein QN178_15820 [Armatimonadota bacterium]|nr:hypothetical protein [Armatimonadota bacterium]